MCFRRTFGIVSIVIAAGFGMTACAESKDDGMFGDDSGTGIPAADAGTDGRTQYGRVDSAAPDTSVTPPKDSGGGQTGIDGSVAHDSGPVTTPDTGTGDDDDADSGPVGGGGLCPNDLPHSLVCILALTDPSAGPCVDGSECAASECCCGACIPQ